MVQVSAVKKDKNVASRIGKRQSDNCADSWVNLQIYMQNQENSSSYTKHTELCLYYLQFSLIAFSLRGVLFRISAAVDVVSRCCTKQENNFDINLLLTKHDKWFSLGKNGLPIGRWNLTGSCGGELMDIRSVQSSSIQYAPYTRPLWYLAWFQLRRRPPRQAPSQLPLDGVSTSAPNSALIYSSNKSIWLDG